MTFDPDKLRIVIPTYRRSDHQVTFSHIPTKWHGRTTFVVDEHDRRRMEPIFGHTAAEYLVVPPEVTTIAAKRAWIISQTQWNKVLMLDDDLRFCSRRTGSGLPTALTEEVHDVLCAVEDKLDTVVHCGISSRQGNNHFDEGWNPIKRMMYALGWRTDTMREVCELGRINTREDFDYTLQLLRRGFPNEVYGYICVDQRYDKDGGCKAEGRTVERSNADAELLARLHPGLVKIKEKAYKTSVPRKEVVVQWARAYEQGRGAVL